MSDYEKLRKLCDEIDELIANQVTTSSPDFITWHTKLDRFLLEKYGESREEYIDFHKRSFNPPLFTLPAMSKLSSEKITQYYISVCKSALETTKAKLLVYLEEMKEKRDVESKMLKYSNMSVVTFLIGNGFDLQLGLNTRYDQFVRWYIGQPPAKNFLKITEFQGFLNKLKKSKYVVNDKTELDIQLKIVEIEELLENDNKSEWLSDLNLPSSTIITIKKFLEEQKSDWLSDINLLLNIIEFKEYLRKNKQSEWWSDAETAMGKYIKNFKDDIDIYYEIVRDFKIRLGEYLKAQDEKFVISDEKAFGDVFVKFLGEFPSEILLKNKVGDIFSLKRNPRYNFITFNYTSALQRIIYATRKTQDYISDGINKMHADGAMDDCTYVHGSLYARSSSEESKIIMGVNDEQQLDIPKDQIGNRLKRTMIKPETNKALGRKEATSTKDLIEQSNVLVIYGWKMGPTDDKWREIIGKWLKNDGRYIVVFGKDKLENSDSLMPEDTLDFVEQKQNEFLQVLYPGIDNAEIENLRDKIFIIDKTNLLDFKNIVSKEN